MVNIMILPVLGVSDPDRSGSKTMLPLQFMIVDRVLFVPIPVRLVPTTETASGAVIATTVQFATMSTESATVYRAFRVLRY
jgi:hypothetical protein